jgi:RNA polymerase sigma-70 factor (ECF subfamily)
VIISDGPPAPSHAATGAAFAQLYQRHYAAVFAFAYRRVGDRARAEDVAAQTFLQALQAFPRYEERGAPVAAWLLRIAANIMAEHARRRRRELPLDDGPPWDEAMRGRGRAGGRDDDWDWVDRWERAQWVRAYLAALSPDQRRALWLRYGEDQALEDVAARLGRSPAATKQLLHRTLKTLRMRMHAGMYPEGDR